MPSFTSSSDLMGVFRPLPDRPWERIAPFALVAALIILGGWEFFWRTRGYSPSINDTPELWAIARDRARHASPETIVLVGDSRIRFDLDHDVVSKAFGGAPIFSLAMNGSVARPVLSELADDESFSGTVLCSYTPGLFWAPAGPPFEMTLDWIRREKAETPARRAGQYVALVTESLFALLNKEDLSLTQLLRDLPLPPRPGMAPPPPWPPYICKVLPNRREIMWKVLEQSVPMQSRIQNIWMALFTMGRPLPPPLLAQLRQGVVDDVERIRARGGSVIFIRFPSTGALRDFEREATPREEYWEPLIAATGCLGIQYEDDERLAHFDCPEWSHLTGADATLFTERLMEILGERGALP